jgi:hypothetical protein
MKQSYNTFFIAIAGVLLGLCFFALLCSGLAGVELASLTGDERDFWGIMIPCGALLAVPVLFLIFFYKTKK